MTGWLLVAVLLIVYATMSAGGLLIFQRMLRREIAAVEAQLVALEAKVGALLAHWRSRLT